MSVDSRHWNLNGPRLELERALRLHPDPLLLMERLEGAPGVTVVVPVYNGGDSVKRCLASLALNTRAARIVVIDDASTDPEVVNVLDDCAERGQIDLIRHETNWGYTRTANQGLNLSSSDDVVLLNSDTLVGPLWLNRLRWTAYSEYDVATVTAVSDNAGAMSVPQPGRENIWPQHLSWDEISRGVMQLPPGWNSHLPTGHGFCMFIRRYAIERLGGFDEAAFPMGYGEENDFCQRAIATGMRNVLAPHVIVHHDRSQSFGEDRKGPLIAAGIKVLNDRYPTYGADVSHWMRADVTKRQLLEFENIREALTHCHRVLPRRLYIIHRSIGGTVETNKDLLESLADEQDSFIFDSSGDGELGLHIWRGTKSQHLKSWKLDKRIAEQDSWRADYAEVLISIIVGLAIEFVHVRHLFQHPLTTAPLVLKHLGIPSVLSTHDFYYVSPSITLLDKRAGIKPGIPVPGLDQNLVAHTRTPASIPMTQEWLATWQGRAKTALDSFDAIVATTESAAEVYEKAIPSIPPLHRIEHGRNLDSRWDRIPRERRKAGPLRVAAAANWDPPKGIEYVKQLAASLGPNIEIHILGRNSNLLGSEVVSHGAYTRESLRPMLREIDPDIIGIFSVWPETYSHTLTEAWAFGVPVVSTDIGAVAERIRRHGGGWLVPVHDSEAAAELLAGLAADREQVEAMRDAVPRDSIRGTLTMSRDYLDLYRSVLHSKAINRRVGYVIRETKPASAHIRILRRLSHPDLHHEIAPRQVSSADFARGSDLSRLDVLLVQRDAVLPEHVDALITRVQEQQIRLVLELDDDLLSSGALGSLRADPYYDASRLEGIAKIAAAADAIIVSTPALEKVAAEFNSQVFVVPNELDDRLWLSQPYAAEAPSDGVTRLLYMGTKTHREDFDLLVPVMENLHELANGSILLETIGVGDGLPKAAWLKQIPVPARLSSYPMFTTWLRSISARWSLGLAPLTERAVNHTKSDLKLLEYALLGLPVVASAVGPYSEPSDGLAISVPNSPAAWTAAITDALEQRSFSLARLDQARSYVLEKRMLQGENMRRWSGIVSGTSMNRFDSALR